MSGFSASELAAELRTAENERRGVALPTDRFPELDWAAARATARARDQLRLADGDRLIGYKLGWTSAAMREALGIDQPNWGTLWASQILGPTMDLDTMIHPKVEPEFVYVAGAPLAGDVTNQNVIDACAGWAVGLEVVDPRFPSFDFRWLDNTADNSSAAGIRTSRYVPVDRLAGADAARFALPFTDGTESRTGVGDRAMGSPLEAVGWLVRELAGEGERLEAGHIVYTGGITAPFDLTAGLVYTASCGQLGSVTLAPSRRVDQSA
jgi:2-keto-4-pentenoate hydratase